MDGYFLVELLDEPKEKERVGVPVRLLYKKDTFPERVNSKAMAYLQKSQQANLLRYGDRIWIKTRLNPLDEPKNPFEFDYKNYLNLKAIYYQFYADSTSWEMVSHDNGLTLVAKAQEARRAALQTIESWNLTVNQKSVTKALLLGFRSEISDELLSAYSAAGAMHVLAVSGLHVGIVYLLTFYLLFFLEKLPYGKLVRTVLLIMLLWTFALITGMSASVVRAATMFSMVAIASGFKNFTSVFNTIMGSAMLLLTLYPNYLFEVGFQLSYLAVFGIVWLQPRFEEMWKPNGWLLKKVWSITTVSLAAQVATFPLGLYYFHQFPGLFLVSNLLVIPVVTILMYVGLVALLLSLAGWVPTFLVAIYAAFLSAMNWSVNWIEGLDFFLLDQIHISRLELSLLYLLIAFFFTWLYQGKSYRLLVSVVLASFLGLSQWLELRQLKKQKQWVVYATKGHTSLGLYHPKAAVFISDSLMLADDDGLTFHVKHHWWARNAQPVSRNIESGIETRYCYKTDELILFENKSIWLAGTNLEQARQATTWVARGKLAKGVESLAYKPQKLILSAELNYYQRKDWVAWAKKYQVIYWDVQEKGAYVGAVASQ